MKDKVNVFDVIKANKFYIQECIKISNPSTAIMTFLKEKNNTMIKYSVKKPEILLHIFLNSPYPHNQPKLIMT